MKFEENENNGIKGNEMEKKLDFISGVKKSAKI